MATRKVNTYFRILGKEPEHKDLFQKIDKISNIQRSMSKFIPPHLAKHCTIGLPTNGKLTIFAQNGAIATKLKQITPSVLKKIKNLGWEITSIQIATQANSQAKNGDNINPSKRHLGQTGVTSLTQLAETLSDSPLKSAIESLLKNR